MAISRRARYQRKDNKVAERTVAPDEKQSNFVETNFMSALKSTSGAMLEIVGSQCSNEIRTKCIRKHEATSFILDFKAREKATRFWGTFSVSVAMPSHTLFETQTDKPASHFVRAVTMTNEHGNNERGQFLLRKSRKSLAHERSLTSIKPRVELCVYRKVLHTSSTHDF